MDEGIPEQAADLIKKLLVMAPEDRLGARHMEDLNNHPLFKGIDLEKHRSQPPPMELELTKYQNMLLKYLPQ